MPKTAVSALLSCTLSRLLSRALFRQDNAVLPCLVCLSISVSPMYEGIFEGVYKLGCLRGDFVSFFKANLETSCTHLTKTSQNVLDSWPSLLLILTYV
jgi:hypothetical protein